MPRRFRGGGLARRAPQRQISNVAITGNVDGAIPIAGQFKALGTIGINTIDPGTIVRTRGRVLATMASVSGAATILSVTYGVILVSSDAFAAGVASIPGPLSDSGNDWYVWGALTFRFGGTVGDQAIGQTDRVDFDSRGMRKSKPGDTSVFVVEIESNVAGGSVDVAYALREQFKT